MVVYTFGKGERTLAMFQCTAEPWWAFRDAAEAMARDRRVFLFIADGHDGRGTVFVSVEKYASDAAAWLRARGITRLDAVYGVSMGGAAVIRFLTAERFPVGAAVIDAGITPYPYPRPLCRLIALRDWAVMLLGTRSLRLMKLMAPPERWTPAGQDPEEHYRAVHAFLIRHYSSRTIYNVFLSANNYELPRPLPSVDARIAYWYGEGERRARRRDLAFVRGLWPGAAVREMPAMEHAELVMMHPERFRNAFLAFEEGEHER